jgi:N6-adenosine-specific RNA methylase IME4
MSSKYQVIVADPPWDFKDSLKMSDVARGARANYSTMSLRSIKELPISDYSDPTGTLLALWVPSSMLQDGLNIMSAWGFKHKQTYVWVKNKKNLFKPIVTNLVKVLKTSFKEGGKPNWSLITKLCNDTSKLIPMDDLLSFGMGRLFRQTHEICLIGINNTGIYKKLTNRSQRSVSFGENLKHSSKPEHLQVSLETMFPNTEKLELFARRVRPNWTCLGNEICNGEDIAVSLAKL